MGSWSPLLFVSVLGAAAPLSAWAGGLVLEVGDVHAGAPVTFTVVGAAPLETVYLAKGAAVAPGPCPASFSGSCFGVTAPQRIGSMTADGAGSASLTLTVPPGLAVGTEVAFQAVVLRDPAVLSDPIIGRTAGLTGDVVVPEVVYGTVNVDDDDLDGTKDFLGGTDDSDTTPFVVLPDGDGAVRGVTEHRLTLHGMVEEVAIWMDGERVLDAATPSITLPWSAEPLELGLELGGWRSEASLVVQELDASGGLMSEGSGRLVGAPLVIHHHLQPAEHLFTVRTSGGFFVGDNSEFIAPIEAATEGRFTAVPGGGWGNDVWIQDEIEFSTTRTDGVHVDVVMDSIRDRGLDGWAEEALEGVDWGVHTWGSGWADTWDSFGNLEVSPPVTVDGQHYPFGRIYYGAKDDMRPTTDLTDFLAAQEIQAPFEVDISFLCVGHVDEFVSFIPDSTAPKGFRMIYTDTNLAWEIMASVDPDTALTRYRRGHGYADVAEFLEDSRLRDYNDDIQVLFLDPIKEAFFEELGLDEEDVIYVPGLFEDVCGLQGVALIPGFANLVVFNPEGETSKLLIADPFFRTDTEDPATDPFIAEIESSMPAEHEIVWVDDWNDYHLLWGEVHCGTNVVRTPDIDWWSDADARDLLGE